MEPIMKYTGSKHSLAPWICSYFPEHARYVEPFCGSAAVFFQKKPATHEVLNDLNGAIVNLFRVIRERGDELASLIEMTPWSEQEYAMAEKGYTDGDELEQARRFLIRSWQAHGGTMSQVSGWKHNGLKGNVYPSRLWTKLPDRLLSVVDRLRSAEIRNRPALEIIGYYDDPETLLYVDPPYPLSPRSRKYYLHEMTDGEHVELLEMLDKFSGAAVLSGYSCPLYDERLTSWQKATMPTSGEHGKKHVEVLWFNSKAQHRQLSMFEEAV